jgi:orotate phosphoribosyltransferase
MSEDESHLPDPNRVTVDALRRTIYATAHLQGQFTLRSGVVSREYLDKYLFESQPALLRAIVEAMLPLLPPETEVLAGLELGGVPVATALSLRTGIPAAFIRKAAKEYGTRKLAEGIDVGGRRVCIVEDVITSGGQVLRSAADLRALGARVEHVVCVILRDPAAVENLSKHGLELRPLFTMDELRRA